MDDDIFVFIIPQSPVFGHGSKAMRKGQVEGLPAVQTLYRDVLRVNPRDIYPSVLARIFTLPLRLHQTLPVRPVAFQAPIPNPVPQCHSVNPHPWSLQGVNLEIRMHFKSLKSPSIRSNIASVGNQRALRKFTV